MPDVHPGPRGFETEQFEEIVEGGGKQKSKKTPQHGGMDEPFLQVPGWFIGGGFTVALEAALGKRLDRDGIPDRIQPIGAHPFHPLPSHLDDHVDHAHQNQQADNDHSDHADSMNERRGNEVEELERVGWHGTMNGVHAEADHHREQNEEDGAQDGRSVEQFCKAKRIITGDGVATGGGHELAGVGLLGAGLGAFTAVVAQPEFLAAEQLVLSNQVVRSG